jgi:hypothetical protein
VHLDGQSPLKGVAVAILVGKRGGPPFSNSCGEHCILTSSLISFNMLGFSCIVLNKVPITIHSSSEFSSNNFLIGTLVPERDWKGVLIYCIISFRARIQRIFQSDRKIH